MNTAKAKRMKKLREKSPLPQTKSLELNASITALKSIGLGYCEVSVQINKYNDDKFFAALLKSYFQEKQIKIKIDELSITSAEMIII
jgi:hypothetical protein